jgi:hypothetical protein
VRVTYRFDTLPHALTVAVPCNYNNTLFGKLATGDQDSLQSKTKHDRNGDTTHENSQLQQKDDDAKKSSNADEPQKISSELVNALMTHGRKVTVIGQASNPEKKQTYILAGTTIQQGTGDVKPVAIVVNGETILLSQDGRQVPSENVLQLQEGAVIVVEGKKSKRGVIHASRLIV